MYLYLCIFLHDRYNHCETGCESFVAGEEEEEWCGTMILAPDYEAVVHELGSRYKTEAVSGINLWHMILVPL